MVAKAERHHRSGDRSGRAWHGDRAWFGAALGVVMHTLQRGRRDFAAVTMTASSRCEVVVDDDVADEAARLLGDVPREQNRDKARTDG